MARFPGQGEEILLVTHPPRQLWHLLLVVLAVAVARAQPVPATGHETEAETVAKCVADMASKEAGTRRRAILVLGKYPANPTALMTLQRALQDPDALVRRSALVSFSEQRALPMPAIKPILGLLEDPDVHVRRIASSMLPELLLRNRLAAGGGIRPPIRPGTQPNRPADPTVELLNKALGDADATVVKNVLSASGMLLGELDVGRIAACLQREDREVRVLALQTLQRYPMRKEEQMAAALAPLTKDKDEAVRQETAKLLARCGATGIPSLRVLAKDSASAVRLAAARQLILFQDADSAKLLHQLVLDATIPPDERAGLVHYLLREDPPHVELLKQLADDGPAEVRAAALRSLGSRQLGDRTPAAAFFMKQLQDPSVQVRQAAAGALLSVSPRLDEETVRQFLDSKYPDVRQSALVRARLLPPEQAREILLDACLDDDLDVRCAALMQLALAKVPGWEDILAQSLNDPEERIRRTAINALGMRGSERSAQVLREFLKTCDDPGLVRQIQLILSRQTRQPLVPPRGTRPIVRPAPRNNP
jgi:HEAT repeat protein